MRSLTIVFLSCLLVVVGVLLSCKSNKRPSVVVNLLRDGQSSLSPVIERRLLAFQGRQPKTQAGKAIIVQAILPTHGEFKHILSDASQLSNMKPDVVVLDSSQQLNANSLVKREAANSKNVCGNEATCPAFIPSWVSGEKLEASQQVLKALLPTDR